MANRLFMSRVQRIASRSSGRDRRDFTSIFCNAGPIRFDHGAMSAHVD